MGTTKKVAVVKPRKAEIQKKARSQGAAKMSAAANKTLEDNCEKIALSLLASTLKGNINSAKALYDFAAKEAQRNKEGVKRRHPSIAKRLATETQWDSEMSEAEAETSYGGREPEG
jgi:hypothetical protein